MDIHTYAIKELKDIKQVLEVGLHEAMKTSTEYGNGVRTGINFSINVIDTRIKVLEKLSETTDEIIKTFKENKL